LRQEHRPSATRSSSNTLGTDGWEIDHITAAPLTTEWVSLRGGTVAAAFTDKVHCLAVMKRARGDDT